MEKIINWLTPKKTICLIAIFGFLVYANSLFNGFVWDDEEQIVNNAIIQNLYNWPQIFSGATFSTGGAGLSGWFFRPFLTLYYMLNFAVWKNSAFGFHLVQVIFHIVNSLLLFFIIRKLLKKGNEAISLWISAILSVIFAVHPAFVEAVSYIAAVNYVMLTFFNLLALYAVLKAKNVSLKLLLSVSLLIFSGLLFNESSIVIIPILAIYLFIFKDNNWKKWISSLTMIAAFYFFVRLILVKTPIRHPEFSNISEANLMSRIITIPKEILSYLKVLFFPKDLAVSQHFVVKSVSSPDFLIPFMAAAFFFASLLLIAIKFKSKLIFWGLCWFVVGFGLVSNIFPLDMTIAERWIYFPGIGLFLVLAGIIDILLDKSKKAILPLSVIFLMVLTIFSIRTMARNTNWHDGYTLFSNDVNISKNSFDLENNLGVELFRRGDFKNAKVRFENSIALQPKWYFAYNNLGAVYEQEKNYQKAKELYYKTLAISDYYIAYENIAGILLFWEDDPAGAKEFAQNALKKLPQNGKLWLNLALSDYKLNNRQEALQAAENAYRFSPNDQTVYVYYQLSNNLPLEFK